MKHMFMIVAVVMGLFAGTQSAYAQPAGDQSGGSFQGRPGGGKRMQWLQELNLTDEQKTQMKALHDKHRSTMESQKSSMKSAHEAFKSAIESNASDDDLRQKFKTLHDLKSKMAELRFNQMLEIRSILTDEQKAKFKGFQQMLGGGRRGNKRGGGFQNGGNPPPPPEDQTNDGV